MQRVRSGLEPRLPSASEVRPASRPDFQSALLVIHPRRPGPLPKIQTSLSLQDSSLLLRLERPRAADHLGNRPGGTRPGASPQRNTEHLRFPRFSRAAERSRPAAGLYLQKSTRSEARVLKRKLPRNVQPGAVSALPNASHRGSDVYDSEV